MISRQVNSGKKKRRNQVGPQKARITHTGIEHGDDLGIARHAGSKENDGDQGKYRPKETVDIGNEIKIVIK